MALPLERVLDHATRQLANRGYAKQNELVPLYRKFLKIEEHRLRLRHNAGEGGVEICRSRAQLLDIVIRHLFDGAEEYTQRQGLPAVKRLAVVATGGYGRSELNPFSDVDIMFLHNSLGATLPPNIKEVVTQMLYLLWDVGFKVGHSTRNIASAVAHANEDMLSKTSLLESRLVAGDRGLFEEFREQFDARCVRARGMANAYILWRMQNQAERHAKYGGTVFLQEPNIKNAPGGLRDYHNLLWVAYFKTGASSLTELVRRKFMSESERRALRKAHDFLLRVRNDLHYLNGRTTDTLTIYYQGQIANRFNYPQKNIILRSESFMRDYFQNARTVHLVTQAVAGRLSLPALPNKELSPKIFSLLARDRRKSVEEFEGFSSHAGLIYAATPDVFEKDPLRLIRVFHHAQRRQLSLSPELQQKMRRRMKLVTRDFIRSKSFCEIFLDILSRKGEVGRVLRMMHEVDLLGRFVPEFAPLTCLVQHEFFHRYTADEHTLVCLEKLDAMIDTEEPKRQKYREVFQKVENPELLYLALLMHDVGKAQTRRTHAEVGAMLAHQACRRFGLSPERRRMVVLLVDHHVSLSQIAQTRNLDDPETIRSFASVVRNAETLDMLLLLTLADAQGTTGDVWSDWKESLALQLYRETRRCLTEGHDAAILRQTELGGLRTQVERLLPKDFGAEIEAHFNGMPSRYFGCRDAEEIAAHIQLFREFILMRMDDPARWLGAALRWLPKPDQGHTELWIVTWDRRALFQRIAGSLAVAGVNILSADIFTRSDDLVFDIFRVCDTNFEAVSKPKTLNLFEQTLMDSLVTENFDLSEKIVAMRGHHRQTLPEFEFPTKIAIINDISSEFTVVEIRTPDRLGLLYDLLHGFYRSNINIELSRISTEKGAAIDTFYVTGPTGEKIVSPDEIRTLQNTLRVAALGETSPNPK